MKRPEYEQRPDWPELREYIEGETLQMYGEFLRLLDRGDLFSTLTRLRRLARKLKRPDVDKLGEHIYAFSRSYSRFLKAYEILLASAEKTRAQRSGPLQ